MAAKKQVVRAQVARGPKIIPGIVIPDALKKALKYTFINEGGYSDVPGDAGGATSRFGTTIGELSRWRGYPVSKLEVRNMPEEEANQIYYFWYWKTLDLDAVTAPNIACAIFDIGIVMGIGAPPAMCQQVCNDSGAHLAVDGHIGPLTIAAINDVTPAVFIRDFSVHVETRFRGIAAAHANDRQFLRGWINRAHRLLTLIPQSAA